MVVLEGGRPVAVGVRIEGNGGCGVLCDGPGSSPSFRLCAITRSGCLGLRVWGSGFRV